MLLLLYNLTYMNIVRENRINYADKRRNGMYGRTLRVLLKSKSRFIV